MPNPLIPEFYQNSLAHNPSILKGFNALLRDICQPDEMKASQSVLRSRLKIAEIDTLRNGFNNTALQGAQSALHPFRQKGSNEDLTVFRNFLWDIGNRVAQAAKEVGFLGFGGERVSENERAPLSELSVVLERSQSRIKNNKFLESAARGLGRSRVSFFVA